MSEPRRYEDLSRTERIEEADKAAINDLEKELRRAFKKKFPSIEDTVKMEYVYAAMLLHRAKKMIDEKNLGDVLMTAGITVDAAKLKAFILSMLLR